MVEYFVTKGKLIVRNGAPLVVSDGGEKALSQVEFILWTSLHRNVLNKESLKAAFDRRMRKYNLNLDVSFEQTLNRLKTRGLLQASQIILRLMRCTIWLKICMWYPLERLINSKKQ